MKQPWWQPATNHPRRISSFTNSCKLQFASFSLGKQVSPNFGTQEVMQNQLVDQVAHPSSTFTSVSSECSSSGNFPAHSQPQRPMRPKNQETNLTAFSRPLQINRQAAALVRELPCQFQIRPVDTTTATDSSHPSDAFPGRRGCMDTPTRQPHMCPIKTLRTWAPNAALAEGPKAESEQICQEACTPRAPSISEHHFLFEGLLSI